MLTRAVLSLSLLWLTLLLLLFSAPAHGAEDANRAQLEIDCSQSAGELSKYQFGATSGFFYDAKGLALCKQAGFQIMEVVRDMTADPFGPGPLPPPGLLPPPSDSSLPALSRPHPPRPAKILPPAPGPLPERGRDDSFQERRRLAMAARPRLCTFEEVRRITDECLRQDMEVMVAFTILGPPRNEEEFQKQVTIEVKGLQRLAASHKTRINLFRFGCEPELQDFWRGTPKQFFHTYQLWVSALKSFDPQAIAVAPGFAPAILRADDQPVTQFMKDFLSYCHDEKTPLDIVTIHGYGLDPDFSFAEPIRVVGEYLKKYPRLSPIFGIPRIGDNEWNLLCRDPYTNPIFKTAWAAAHNVAAMIHMIKAGASLTVRLGGCSVSDSETRITGDEPDFLLVNQNHEKKPTYYGMAAFNRFNDFPLQVISRSDNRNFDILAGFSRQRDKLYIAICNLPRARLLERWRKVGAHPEVSQMEDQRIHRNESNSVELTSYDLKIMNLSLSPRNKVKLRRYRLDEKANGALVLVEDKILKVNGTIALQQDLPGPAIDFILLDAQ